MHSGLLIRILSLAALAGSIGCSARPADGPRLDPPGRQDLGRSIGSSPRPTDCPKSLEAFPAVLYVGKPMTRAVMVRVYPGCAKYLVELATASKVPLLERVRASWPAYSPDFVNENADWTVSPALKWGPYQVFLLTKGTRHNQVILGTPDGRYHLLVLDVMDDLGGRIDTYDIQGQLVLNYHARESGTGHCTLDESFVLDAARTPQSVESTEVICEALRKVLPEGYTVQYGGGWNLPNLTYNMFVYKPGEGGPHPTGGMVGLAFDLVGDKLVPTKYYYEAGFYEAGFGPDGLRNDDPAWTAPPRWKPWSDISAQAHD